MDNVAQRLSALNLPPVSQPLGSYVAIKRSGNLIFTSGCLPFDPQGNLITGRVGESLTLAQGQQAARQSLLYVLAVLAQELGGLSHLARIQNILKITGFIQTTSNFQDHPQVLNGASDLLVEIFGEKGKHARAAVGVFTLPKNAAVEIEMIVEVSAS